MSGILSIAARKAAAESGKIASVAGAFLLVLAVSVGVIPNLASTTSEEIISQPAIVSEDSGAPSSASPNKAPLESPVTDPETAQAPSTTIPPEAAADNQGTEVVNVIQEPTALAAENLEDQLTALPSEESIQRGLIVESLQETLNGAAAVTLASSSFGSSAISPLTPGYVELSTGSGLTGQVSFDAASNNGIQSAWLKISVGGKNFIAVPNVSFSQKTIRQDGSMLIEYIATDLLIGDASGEFEFVALNDTVVSRSAIRVNLVLDSNGELLNSSLSLTPRA